MLKIVLSDYRQNWKNSWKNLAKEGWYSYLYSVALPLIMHMKEREAIVYLCAVAPLVLGMLLSRLYPNRLQKTLFFCPMSKKDRIAYFKTAFRFRVSLPLILFFMANAILVGIHYISITAFFYEFVVTFLYVVSVNIYWCYWSDNGKRNIYTEKNPLAGTFFIWDALSGVGIINMIICTGLNITSMFDYVIVAILFAIQLFEFFKLITCYYKKVMELSVNYEAGYVKNNR